VPGKSFRLIAAMAAVALSSIIGAPTAANAQIGATT
jgi:hypothetical protein